MSLADYSAAEFAEKIIHSNIPDCVHVFVRSDANSSLRTQSAAAALNALVSGGGHEFDQRYRTQVMNRCKKQKHLLIDISPPSTLTPISWETDIKHKVVVFDGGIGITPPGCEPFLLFLFIRCSHYCSFCHRPCLTAAHMELHQCI